MGVEQVLVENERGAERNFEPNEIRFRGLQQGFVPRP